MEENVKCIEPNLAIFFRDAELKHYNLIYGKWQYDDSTPSYVTYITNMLVQKTSDGEFIPPAYPTAVELQTQVTSLDYDGEHFWSVQKINNTPSYPGWVLSKWYINDDLYALDRAQFKVYPGFVTANCLAVEWYTTTLKEPVHSGINYMRLWITDKNTDIFKRIQPGFKIKIGPNNAETPTSFWGTVRRARWVPDSPYYKPYEPNKGQYTAFYYEIEFEENFNSSYVAGEDVFINCGLFVFDSGDSLKRLHPTTLEVMEEWSGGEFTNINACAFTQVNNVPNINVGMRTPALFYIRDMVIYCRPVDNMDHVVSTQILEKQFNQYGNSFIKVHELRVRNDRPDEPTNYPQHYLLQKKYRDNRNIDSGTPEWDTYNYILQKLHAEPVMMQVDVQPQFVSQSGIAYCSCRITDDYGFPVSGAEVTWSHNCGGKAHFLDATTSGTDIEGYVYNRLYADEHLDFPAYVTATTDEIE